jgi:hypothetical protein
MEKQGRLTIANALKEATTSYFLKKGYSCFLELGLNSWGKLRGDVLAINLRGEIIVIEVKSSKADFVSDKKWEQYLSYSNKLYFVFTPGVFNDIKSLILSKLSGHGVGVLILDINTGYLRNVIPAKRRLMKKKTKRLLTLRMAWRNGISKRNNRRKRQFLPESTII